MKRTPRSALATGLVAVALLVGACGGDEGASIAGTYTCLFGEEAPPGAPEITAELREDGTLTVTPRGTTTEGTWSVEGDQGAWHFEDRDESFTVEGEALVHEDGFVCTPAE